jgi:hypothetical protein
MKTNWIGHILRRDRLITQVIEGKIEELTGRRGRRCKRLLRGSIISHSVDNSLWKKLWTCRKTGYEVNQLYTKEQLCSRHATGCHNVHALLHCFCSLLFPHSQNHALTPSLGLKIRNYTVLHRVMCSCPVESFWLGYICHDTSQHHSKLHTQHFFSSFYK